MIAATEKRVELFVNGTRQPVSITALSGYVSAAGAGSTVWVSVNGVESRRLLIDIE